MVIEDLSHHSSDSANRIVPALASVRFFAALIDFALLAPLVSFVPAYHIRELRLEYAQGFNSTTWFQVAILATLTFIVVQTGFVYFFKATPGQSALGLRVRSLNPELTWNQCLMRATFYTLSWFLGGLPLLEVISHRLGRAWHDRVSDTMVVEKLGTALAFSGRKSGPTWDQARIRTLARTYMILGLFALLIFSLSMVEYVDALEWTGSSSSSEKMDTLVARALLKKDDSEETRAQIEERLWRTQNPQEKALAYYYRFQNEQDKDVKTVLSQKMCEWGAQDLCLLTEYELAPSDLKLTKLITQTQASVNLASQVGIMRELTRKSKITSALHYYEKLKEISELNDELRIWDVSLFLKIKDRKLRNRAPASTRLESALKEYEKERGEP